MNQSNQNVTFKGKKLTVLGRELSVGDRLPAFTLTATDMSDLTDAQYQGKIVLLSVVPSLDTPTCQVQTRRLNQEANKLSTEVVILTVSMDLPFAQARWCGAEGIERIKTASDYKYRSFGEAFGVYIEEMGLLARALFVIDRQGTVQHVEYVANIADEPDYNAALTKIKSLVK